MNHDHFLGRKTLGRQACIELIEKKSRFIGYAAPVSNEEEARRFLAEIREKHRDATHNVYAYYLNNGAIARCSDDGEPQGTAGMPVLNSVKMSGATDLCVVVTRYFGGILLGSGGLIRAYSAAARKAIEEAGIVSMTEYAKVLVSCSYSDYQRLATQLPKIGVTEDGASFDTGVSVSVGVEKCRLEEFREFLTEFTCGRANIVVLGEEERPSRGKS